MRLEMAYTIPRTSIHVSKIYVTASKERKFQMFTLQINVVYKEIFCFDCALHQDPIPLQGSYTGKVAFLYWNRTQYLARLCQITII